MCPQGGFFNGNMFFSCLSVYQSVSVFTVCLPLVTVGDETSADFDTAGVYGGLEIAPPFIPTRVQ